MDDVVMGNSRVTVREIAEIAGVSIATVSRVSRGGGQVSPALRARVLGVIEEQGYRPSHLGRALAEKRHGSLAVVFPGLSGPYFSEMIQGFESEALDTGSSVHVVGMHGRTDADDRVVELASRVDGIVVHGGTIQAGTLTRLRRLCPVVVLAGPPVDGVAAVRADNAGLGTLVDHLVGHHGYTDLAFVGEPEGSPDVTERWQAFRAALRRGGLEAPRAPARVGLQQQDGVIAAGRLLGTGRPPQAVVCANDETALGVLMGALGRGLRVPQDLAITGFDDVPISALVQPALTTVRQPIRELAATTARLLIDATRGADLPPDTVLGTEVVVRQSCGCGST